MRLELRAWRTELAMHPRNHGPGIVHVHRQHASHEIWNEEPATVAKVFSNIVLVMRKAPLSMHEGPLEGVPKIGCRCLETHSPRECMHDRQPDHLCRGEKLIDPAECTHNRVCIAVVRAIADSEDAWN